MTRTPEQLKAIREQSQLVRHVASGIPPADYDEAQARWLAEELLPLARFALEEIQEDDGESVDATWLLEEGLQWMLKDTGYVMAFPALPDLFARKKAQEWIVCHDGEHLATVTTRRQFRQLMAGVGIGKTSNT